MAYVNVAEWVPDQVAEWLRGLEDVIQPYIHSFVTNKVNGKRLLHLCASDLLALNIKCIGHQEIIIKGVELLCNIHYHLHQENIQNLALRISSKARSIYNDLRVAQANKYLENSWHSEERNASSSHKNERVSTKILAAVADCLSSVKVIVSWFHKPPFHGMEEYDDLKSLLVELSIGLATIAQRDAFAEKQSSVIKESCFKLAEIADKIIQDSKDPMILQPASLEIATIRKRADDNLGISLVSSYEGIHQIAVLRALSPAHNCGKLMGGDQIVQVNYQTVVGWTSLKVTQLMQENPTEVIVTLKKCPRHINTHTKIYFKPIRLPSKKRTYSPWETINGISSHRFDLQSIPNLPFMKCVETQPLAVICEPETKSTSPPLVVNSIQSLNSTGSDMTGITRSDQEESEFSDDAFMSDSDIGAPSSLSVRMFLPKPRPSVQRRATVPGGTARPSISFDHILQEYCKEKRGSELLRTNNNHITRPHTHMGVATQKNSFKTSKSLEQTMPFIDDQSEPHSNDSGRDSASSDDSPPIESSRPESLKKCSQSLSQLGQFPPSLTMRKISEERPKLDKTISSPMYADESYDVTTQCSVIDQSFSDVSSQHHSDIKCLDSSQKASVNESDRSSLRSSDLSDSSRVHSRDSTTTGGPGGSPTSGFHQAPVSTHPRGNTDATLYANIPANSAACASPCDSMHSRFYVNLHPGALSGGRCAEALPPAHSSSPGPNTMVYNVLDNCQPNPSVADRRISCRDLGPGDQQGWLYRRCESKGFLLSHRWLKRWFILKKSNLYGYKDEESLKANSLVYLPGFQVSPAPEVKAKRFAFKISHATGATFHFACSSAEERSRWMSQMGLAAMTSQATPIYNTSTSDPYFSETDEEGDDKSSQKSPFVHRKPTFTPKSNSCQQNSSVSSHKSQTLKFLQPSKLPLGQPVPTPNFRSYVRVRESHTPDLNPPRPDTKETPLKDVKRKNSFRQRLKQLPASLTIDRKKNKTSHPSQVSQPVPGSSPKRVCTPSKSETSLFDKQLPDCDINHSQSNMQLPTMPPVPTPPEDTASSHSRRKSFDGIRSQLSAPGSRQGICSLDDVSSGEEWLGGEDNWTNSLRSVPTKCKVPPAKRVGMVEAFSMSEPQLKKVNQYHPVTLGRDKKEPMRTAFELCLSSSEQVLNKMPDAPCKRPTVPPRTKFLSPKELMLTTPPTRANVPPNLVISPASEEGDSPRTPHMPAMGIAMIGKQRRTPSSISPREVFFTCHSSKHQTIVSPCSSSLSLSLPPSQTRTRASDKVLPHYPGMEYPPTFEPESYTLNMLPDGPSPSHRNKSPSVGHNQSYSSLNGSYINVGPGPMDESLTQGYHHQIYVTSPYVPEGRVSSFSMSTPRQSPYQTRPQTPPDGNSFHSNSYLSMGSTPSPSEYINMTLKGLHKDARSARK